MVYSILFWPANCCWNC